jgi:hypothetical protein
MEERGRPRTRRDVHMLDVDDNDNSSRRVDSSDRRSLSRTRARSRSRSPVQQRYHAIHSIDVRNPFEKICDIFYNQLFITYGSGNLIDHDLIKDHIERFFIKNAQDDAPTIVKEQLERFPKERFPNANHNFFLYIKANTYISSNNSAPINVRLYPEEEEELISKIYNIFELELEKQEAEKRRQENEKQTDALSEMLASSSIGTERQTEALSKMLASANIAKGNKTYYTNKKTYRRKKNTYNSRNKKSKNKKPKNKKTYRRNNKK